MLKSATAPQCKSKFIQYFHTLLALQSLKVPPLAFRVFPSQLPQGLAPPATHYTAREIPRLLPPAGADPNIRRGARGTSLHRAATSARSESVDLLLRHSPNVAVNSSDNTGSMPLHVFHALAAWALLGCFRLLKNARAGTGLTGQRGLDRLWWRL